MSSLKKDFSKWKREGRFFNGFTWVLQYGLMALIASCATVSACCTIPINVLGLVMGNIALPENSTSIDLLFFVGFPMLMLLGFIFIFLCIVYKWLWKMLSKMFTYSRTRHKKYLDYKYEKKDKENKIKQKEKKKDKKEKK